MFYVLKLFHTALWPALWSCDDDVEEEEEGDAVLGIITQINLGWVGLFQKW